MMRSSLVILLLLPALVFGQEQIVQERIKAFKSCHTEACELSESIRIAELFLETDHMDQAQEWLNYAKKIHRGKSRDSISYFINSLQSEIFYYTELYQFGQHEAEKGIECAKILKDSAFLADAHFFKGINQIEMKLLAPAERDLHLSEKYYPRDVGKHIRTIIGKAYIYNNLAQIKLELKQLDSAFFYNRKVYALAKAGKNYRGIVNGEQTFGLIYAEKKQADSAVHYLTRSLSSAIKYGMEDVATINCAYLMKVHLGDSEKVRQYYQKGLDFIANHEINNTYKRYFYAEALAVLKKMGDKDPVSQLQEKIIAVNEQTNGRANRYIENIMERYMTNENNLLNARINELDQERDIRILQLVAAIFGVLVLLFVAIIFRRKNKLQRLLLDQKSEISQDLHDDIGSELSSILINANLLIKNFDTNDKQKLLLDKIAQTGTEISERLNTFIWSLNTENNHVSHFCEYVNRYGSKLLEGSGVAFRFSQAIQGVEARPLDGYFRKNLFFCIKETINNAVKHSGATEISVTIGSPDRKGLQIVVSDNGSGASQTNPFGNGLRNVQKRISSLRGTVKYQERSGLAVIFSVPFPAR